MSDRAAAVVSLGFYAAGSVCFLLGTLFTIIGEIRT